MYEFITLTLTGLFSGVLGGLVGAGAEIAIVPMLSIFGILGNLKSQIATSLIMLLPPIGLFTVIRLYKEGYGNIYAGIYMAILFTIASYVSSKYMTKIDINMLRKFFGIFTVVSGIYILYSKESIEL